MLPELFKIKGVHPGTILKRELKHLDLKANEFAKSIDEHKQTISAILNKRRAINPKLSIKLSKKFKVEDDYFMLLQASYDVKMASKSELKVIPNINNFRKVLFWDTTFDKIDWQKNKRAIINRVLERGNEIEINEITAFYGKEAILDEIKSIDESRIVALEEIILKSN